MKKINDMIIIGTSAEIKRMVRKARLPYDIEMFHGWDYMKHFKYVGLIKSDGLYSVIPQTGIIEYLADKHISWIDEYNVLNQLTPVFTKEVNKYSGYNDMFAINTHVRYFNEARQEKTLESILKGRKYTTKEALA